jgi:hypothetical protein
MYFNARYYSQTLGRFVSADSIVPGAGEPQALNRYAYSLTNPLKYTDPSGHFVESPLDALFIAWDVVSIGVDAYDIATNGGTDERWRSLGIDSAALVIDVALLFVPVGTGGGPALRLAAASGDVAQATRHLAQLEKLLAQAGVKGVQIGNLALSTTGNGSTTSNRIAAIAPPTNRSGLRQAMEQQGGKPTGFVELQAHHELPWDLKDWFAGEGRGLNVNDPQYGRWVEGAVHRGWSSQYTQAWRDFQRLFPNATREQVWAYLEQLNVAARFHRSRR